MRDADDKRRMLRVVPLALGGAALAVGLVLGFWPRGESTPASDAGVMDGGASQGGAAGYVPDLSGPDLGKVLVRDVELSSGMGVSGGRLVWLATERAALYTAGFDKPTPFLRYEGDPKAFGGTLAASEKRVCWAVLGSEPPQVLCLAGARLSDREAPELVAEGGSPDHLSLDGEHLYWADRGRLFGWSPGGEEPAALAAPGQRIATLTALKGRALWLELPYAAGARGRHRVMAWKDGTTKTLATLSEERDRRHLWTDGEHIGWAEGGEDWEIKALDGKTVAQTGEVTGIVVGDGRLYWAEAHDVDGGVVTLLRRASVGGGPAERLGRVTGPVGAMSVYRGTLYWSETRGIVAHRLK